MKLEDEALVMVVGYGVGGEASPALFWGSTREFAVISSISFGTEAVASKTTYSKSRAW
jgi:hypothetical protein